MSDSHHFPIDLLPAVAEDIADFFGEEGYVESGATLVVGPPIEVYTTGLVPPETPAPSLEEVVTWTERFHHQVLDGRGAACGYALTRWSAGEILVCKISASATFAGAVEAGLVSLRKHMPKEAVVRVVSVPEMQVESLWSFDPTNQVDAKLMVIQGPEEAELELFQELTEEQFMEVLMTKGPFAGIVLPMMDSLYDRPLMAILCASSAHLLEVRDEIPTTLVLQDSMEIEYDRRLSA